MMATEAVIGSSPRMRPAAAVTAAAGSLAKRMITKPIAAFQKPITVHGKVTRNSASSTTSSASRPPADSAWVASPISRRIVASTRPAKMIRRTVSVSAAARRTVRSGGRGLVSSMNKSLG